MRRVIRVSITRYMLGERLRSVKIRVVAFQMQLLLYRNHHRRFYLVDGDISFHKISAAAINPSEAENRIVKYWDTRISTYITYVFYIIACCSFEHIRDYVSSTICGPYI